MSADTARETNWALAAAQSAGTPGSTPSTGCAGAEPAEQEECIDDDILVLGPHAEELHTGPRRRDNARA
jgi:hypothetical protein